ncbi:hypothetical protein [Draconibacterium sp.]|uniref:hypothetical protein n=1 Tax=Draconibacterium sp. TaxID=1965318 RepID=UPI0035655973
MAKVYKIDKAPDYSDEFKEMWNNRPFFSGEFVSDKSKANYYFEQGRKTGQANNCSGDKHI